MNKAAIKRTGFYFLMLQMAVSLGGCQTLTAPLKANKNNPAELENPTQATQVPEKIEHIKAREARTNGLLQEAELAISQANYAEASRIYEALLAEDTNNLKAKEGLNIIAAAQRHDGWLAEAEVLMSEADDSNRAEKIEAALAKLHQVLLENSQHPQALAINGQLLAEQLRLIQAKSVKKLAFNQPVTMEFRDVNIKMIFESLSKTTKINFILDKDVPSDLKATIFVKSVAFNDALDLLLQTNQLEKKVLSDNSAIIYVNDPLRQREYKDLSVRSYPLDYADPKQLSGILKTMLNIRNIEIDSRSNTLLIKDSPEILALAEKIIYAQDKPEPEVMLEMQVMEIKRSYLQELGVDTPTGLTVPVPSTGVLTVKDLRNVTGNSLVVNGVPGLIFNTTNGDVNLLANPRIRVKNKEIAKIHIGEKVPVFTSNVASTGVTSQTVQYIDTGLKLEVEPTVSSSEDISIKINLNVGSLGDKVVATTGGNESVAFRVGTRLTTTQLRLHDGETQILAGLIDDQDRKSMSGIPGLHKIPLLGKLFSNQTDDKVKTEIVLSVTPHIIRPRALSQAHESEIWVGPEGRAGKRSASPRFEKGASPFTVPKPPAAPAAPKAETPANLNIPLPEGFSLGTGLNSDEQSTPYLEKNIQRKKELELRQNLREIRTAIDAYKAAYDAGKMPKTMGDSGYPKRLEDLVNGIEDATDPQKKKLFFIRRLPADPMFPQAEYRQSLSENRADEAIDPADTWGKRSYDSDAENPREGRDVYDVYSLNEEVGINGIPYAKW
jgi:general secretion pathway protein D